MKCSNMLQSMSSNVYYYHCYHYHYYCCYCFFLIPLISLSSVVVVSSLLLLALSHIRPLGYVIIAWCQGIITHQCYCTITTMWKNALHPHVCWCSHQIRLKAGQEVHCPTRLFLSHCQVHPLRTILLLHSNNSHWLLFTISYLTFGLTLCFIHLGAVNTLLPSENHRHCRNNKKKFIL